MDVLNALPSSVNISTFKAYVDIKKAKQTANKKLNSLDLEWLFYQPKTLRTLVLDKLIEKWHENPIYSELHREADKIYLLDNIDPNTPVHISSVHIKEDVFWQRCFRNRWKYCNPSIVGKPWIKIYMEKLLAETLEKLEPCDYDKENIENILDACAPYIEELVVDHLEPSLGEKSDHISFEYVLANLPDLKTFRLTFSTKTIGTHYYLGCSWPTRRDITLLARGLQKSYELKQFFLHRTRLEPYMLKILSRSLEKGCTNLETISITHCRFGDRGVAQFLSVLNRESFLNLRSVILTNNLLSQESALPIIQSLKGRQIEELNLRLNPIGSDGAGAIFSGLLSLPIKVLNVSACSISDTVSRMLLKLLMGSKTLIDMDISNNDLGYELGRNIYRVIGFNKILRKLDLRNTGTTMEYRKMINDILFKNREKL